MARARNARPRDTAISSGTRNRRSLALVLSTSVTATASRNTLPAQASQADEQGDGLDAHRDAERHEEVRPGGSGTAAPSRRRPTRRARDRDRRTRAPWPRGSWSARGAWRVVDGDAAGLGDEDDEERRRTPGGRSDATTGPAAPAALTSTPRFSEPAAKRRVKSPSISAGSARAAMVMSRLAPMPPNGLPVSSAAVASAKRPSASVPTSSRIPPACFERAPRPRPPERASWRPRPRRSRPAARRRRPRTPSRIGRTPCARSFARS